MKLKRICLFLAAAMMLSACGSAMAAWNQYEPGNLLYFGTYEQDGNLENGPEEIEWTVLASDDEKALLVSSYVLDALPYNEVREGVTWETCSLRSWLNGEFFEAAFTPEEQGEICETEIDNSAEQGCEKYRGLGGNNTLDRVFLLSYAEAVSLLEGRNCEPTEYAHGRGAALYTDFGTCKWWSRSPGAGTNQQEALCFAMLGVKDSRSVSTATIGVRPALWIWIDGAPE